MKKLLFVALVAIALASCGKDEVSNFKPNPEDRVSINSKINGLQTSAAFVKSSTVHLSSKEIVQQATNLFFFNDSIPNSGGSNWNAGFAGRDTINMCLKRYATDIIDIDGNYVSTFIKAKNCVIVRVTNPDKPTQVIDTIAYIPNSVLRQADHDIQMAFKSQNGAEIYSLFDNALRFVPINGEEYRIMKFLNLQ